MKKIIRIFTLVLFLFCIVGCSLLKNEPFCDTTQNDMEDYLKSLGVTDFEIISEKKQKVALIHRKDGKNYTRIWDIKTNELGGFEFKVYDKTYSPYEFGLSCSGFETNYNGIKAKMIAKDYFDYYLDDENGTYASIDGIFRKSTDGYCKYNFEQAIKKIYDYYTENLADDKIDGVFLSLSGNTLADGKIVTRDDIKGKTLEEFTNDIMNEFLDIINIHHSTGLLPCVE